MRYVSDVIQEIDEIVRPIEQALKIMLAHQNVKAESKRKVKNNLELLHFLQEKYRNVCGDLKEVRHQQ